MKKLIIASLVSFLPAAYAAPFNNAPAHSEAEFLYLKGEFSGAGDLWRDEAALGGADAQYGLGMMKSLNPDAGGEEPAEHWYRLAAKGGHALAQYHLGVELMNPESEAFNPQKGATWLGKAAVQGVAPAQHLLGVAYEFGVGLEKSQDRALFWMRQAANRGNTEAAEWLALYSDEGRKVRAAAKVHVHAAPSNQSSTLLLTNEGQWLHRIGVVEGGWAQVYAQDQQVMGYVEDKMISFITY